MNEELHTRLIKYLDYLETVGKKGAEFVQDQAPETVRQFLLWQIASDAFLALVCIIICAVVYVGIRKASAYLMSTAQNPNEIENAYICAGVGFCVSLVSLGIGIHYIYDALKVWIAPNVFLIEKAAELVKGMK